MVTPILLASPLFQGCKCSLASGGITTQLAALGCPWKTIDFESGKPDVPSLSLLSVALFFGVGLCFAPQLMRERDALLNYKSI